MLIGTLEVALQMHEFQSGFVELGNHAVSVIQQPNKFYPDADYDLTLGWLPKFPSAIERPESRLVRFPRGAARRALSKGRMAALWPYLLSFDLYVFHGGLTLLPQNRDLPILRALGKKIVCVFFGSDVRHWSAAEPARELAGFETYAAYRENQPVELKLHRLRMAEAYADAVIMQPSFAELAVRPYHHLYIAIDIARIPHAIPAREVPRVVHAPSRAELKGTKEILAALRQLGEEGVRYDLRLIEGRPNAEVLRELREADVLVDELRECSYGMVALEAMASGCAVAGGHQPQVVPLPPDRPILPITPSTVVDQLRRLLTDRDLRVQLAARGRPFVERYHTPATAATRIYKALDGAAPDYYPGFFAWRYELPEEQEVSPQTKQLTWRIARRWGLPEGLDPSTLVQRRLLSVPDGEPTIPLPRWESGPVIADRPPSLQP